MNFIVAIWGTIVAYDTGRKRMKVKLPDGTLEETVKIKDLTLGTGVCRLTCQCGKREWVKEFFPNGKPFLCRSCRRAGRSSKKCRRTG